MSARLILISIATGVMSMAGIAAAADEKVIADIDLSAPFSTQSKWRLTAFQGPSVDIVDFGDMPGEVRLCLRKDPSAPCDPQLQRPFTTDDDMYSRPHYLKKADIFSGESDHSLLFLKTASLPSTDGDEFVLYQVLSYRRDSDAFVTVYEHLTGKNNNQTVRFIEKGLLKGHIVSVEPTDNAPFGYWMSVNAPAADGMYKEILRYRSATTYNDGNPLSTVDSEMVNIQKRLGLWKAGDPLPLPERGCPKPHLIRMELWCN